MKTKNKFLTYSLIIIGLLLIFTISCKKEKEPVVTTTDLSSITGTTASCGGNVTDDGGLAVSSKGVCWSTNQNPNIADNKTTDGIGTGVFTSSITGLTSETTYYVRAYATNSLGTSYGNTNSFTTPEVITNYTDIDGNVYQTVVIGNQLWMAENLKATKYNDGTIIPLVENNSTWANLLSPGYCWYNNDSATYGSVYGALYNWYAVNTGILCSSGWHVPTHEEWITLTDYLNGDSIAGGKLKESSTTYWFSPNTGATNETGFTALPAGARSYFDGDFTGIGYNTNIWSSTEYNTNVAWYRAIFWSDITVYKGYDFKKYGFSVRCIRD